MLFSNLWSHITPWIRSYNGQIFHISQIVRWTKIKENKFDWYHKTKQTWATRRHKDHGRKHVHDTKILYSESGCTLTVYMQGQEKQNCRFAQDAAQNWIFLKAHEPDNILHCNTTKVGVDCIDQMVSLYSTKSASRRWPIDVFFNILDLAGINSWILFKSATNSSISRRNFLLDLGKEL